MTTLKHAIELAKKTKERTGKTFVVYRDLEIQQGEPGGYFYTDTLTWEKTVHKYGTKIEVI